jgi:hypothetical protein
VLTGSLATGKGFEPIAASETLGSTVVSTGRNDSRVQSW